MEMTYSGYVCVYTWLSQLLNPVTSSLNDPLHIQKYSKLVVMVATLVARNANKAMLQSGVVCLAGVWSQDVGFVLVCLAGI
jgi:hypothetical protein